MEFNLTEQLMLLVASLIANGFSAIAGGGAGLLQLPLLLFLGLSFSTALATHKIAAVALGLGATLRHWREGTFDLKFCLFVLACGLPGVVLGAFIILSIPESYTKVALGVLTTGLGVYSLLQSQLGLTMQAKHRDAQGYLIGGAMLFFIGVLNGSLTSGTGLFVTLWLVYWFGLDYKRAASYVLLLVGLFWNGSGALAIGLQTPPQWDWLPALVLGALIGAYAGASLAIAKGNQWIKRSFEIVTIAVGLKLLYDGVRLFS